MGAWKKAAVLGGCAFVALQLVPAPPRTNPPSEPAKEIGAHVRLTPHVERLLRRSCANCHSNRTEWPWYSRFAPGSWILAGDVERARRALNLSEWESRTEGRPGAAIAFLAGACAAVEADRMPPSRYLLLHPDARLSAADRRALCAWTQSEIASLTSRSARRAFTKEEGSIQ
jgi:hypothetical protein